MQDIGTYLCWQTFVDDPARDLGLGNLVHIAESPDAADLKKPGGPAPEGSSRRSTAAHPVQPMGPTTTTARRDLRQHHGRSEAFDGKHHGNRTNTNDEDVERYEVVMGPFPYNFDLPKSTTPSPTSHSRRAGQQASSASGK